MRIYLGGHLNFYHPNRQNLLEVEFDPPANLADILTRAGVPLEEVQLVVINGEVRDIKTSLTSDRDEVRVYSAVGGG
jgi:sulfur carrier protein ThiS